MKENEADSWELVNNWLLDLRRRKIAVVIVHHAGRSGEMRGTTRREDNVFWIIALDDARKNPDDKRGAKWKFFKRHVSLICHVLVSFDHIASGIKHVSQHRVSGFDARHSLTLHWARECYLIKRRISA